MATSSNIVSTLGAGSGVDIKALAENLVSAEKTPRKERLDAKINQSEARISGFSAVKYALGEVKAAFEKLNDPSDFAAIQVSNSQPTAIKVTSSESADLGNYDISVSQLAQRQRVTTSPLGSSINGGKPFRLALQVGTGNPVSIDVKDATPAGVASAINNAKTGITAQAINTGSGTQIVLSGQPGLSNAFNITAYRDNTAHVVEHNNASLIISADPLTTGMAVSYQDPISSATVDVAMEQDANANWQPVDASSITATGTQLTIAPTPAEFTFTLFNAPFQDAEDAKLQINGIEVSRGSNRIDNLINGVTLDLLSPTTGTGAQVVLSRETTGIKSNLQALVTAYKELEDTFKILGDKGSEVEKFGGALAGDSLLQSIRNQLRKLVTDPSSTPGSTIKAARDVGLSFDRYGVLQLDESRLDLALQDHFDEVVQMFTADINNKSVFSKIDAGTAGDAVKRLDGMLRSTGIIEQKTRMTNQQITRYKDELLALDERMSRLMDRYLQQFSVMENIVGNSNSTREGLKSRFEGMMSMYTNG